MKSYNYILQGKSYLLPLLFGIIICLYIIYKFNSPIEKAVWLLPIIVLSIGLGLTKSWIPFTFLFIINYFIMGINRYINIPIPITNIFDIIFSIIVAFIVIKQIYKNDDFRKILNVYTFITLIWLLYCIINLGNNVTGEIHFESWLRTIRPLALYPFIISIIISISCKSYKFIYFFLILLAILTILGASRGFWQKAHGFDNTEYQWLMTVGAKTHIVNNMIRYFSFFSDAANFGCSMGLSFVILFISSIYTKNKYIKILFFIASIFAICGLFISGTRAAIAIPFVGLAFFTILTKNLKITILTSFLFLLFFIGLQYTTIGNSNIFIRRMRTAFNTEDASFQVRLDNQKALKAYMKEAPFGIGIGVQPSDISVQNKFYFVSICAPDSDLVYIWMRLGIVGLSIYLVLQFFIYLGGTYILLLRIRNPEIRGTLSGMLCGCAGLLVASYANQVSLQFPNGIISFTCLTLVFIGPYLDKQYTLEHEIK